MDAFFPSDNMSMMVVMRGGGNTVGQGVRGPPVGVVWTGARIDDDGGRSCRALLSLSIDSGQDYNQTSARHARSPGFNATHRIYLSL